MGAPEDVAGLTETEVARRLADGRGNRARQQTSRSVADILRENVFTLFNGILTACFVAVVVIGDLRDGFFFGVVVVNALIGIMQELRAKRVLDRLALLAEPNATVKRDGQVTSVRIEDVVQDDLLVLRTGDQIPADAEVVVSTGLALDEAMLTGESDPVLKDAGAALLSGSHVVGGTGYAVVTNVGAASYANKLTSEIRRHSLVTSELRKATNRILVYISWVLGPLIVITVVGRIFAYGGLREIRADDTWTLAVRDAVASVVGMIPEGLVLLISLAFGVAAIQLATRKVLVQELAAVEVLARVDVLCLDKTGTLTTGELSFDRLIAFKGIPERESAAAVAAFASDETGNATIGVLARHFTSRTITPSARVPFSSATKYSGVSYGPAGGEPGESVSWLLGAPEVLLATHPLALGDAQRHAAAGIRTLALVRSPRGLPEIGAPTEDLAVEPAALLTFRESLRRDAAETLEYFTEQSVRVIVMSGDNPSTVSALAHQLGKGGDAIDASTLSDDVQLSAALDAADVFGRVSPEQKRAAIRLLQEKGRTVAMTGDGVNDAMAIKDADLGIAMGGATAATKAVSRIVLLDDRFASLPRVLALGRRVIANVERVANLFLAKTAYGIVLGLVSAFTLIPYPFLPRQLTLVSALAIGIPSFFLALAPNRRKYTPGVLGRVLRFSIPAGIISAATSLLAFFPLRQMTTLIEARSITTITLFVVSSWILCVLARPLSSARWAMIAALWVVLVLACIIPFSRTFFMLDLAFDAPLLYGIAVGALGAGGIELFYRGAKRRRIVFDRE